MPKSRTKTNPGPTTAALLKKLGLKETNAGVFCGEWLGGGPALKTVSPIDGKVLAQRPAGDARGL